MRFLRLSSFSLLVCRTMVLCAFYSAESKLGWMQRKAL
jgi:hypothetical protein